MTTISTRAARRRLAVRRAPYFAPKDRGQPWALGYNARPTVRSWCVRWRDDLGRYKFITIGVADDDGVGMSHAEAQVAAREAYEAAQLKDTAGGITCAQVMDEYLAKKDADGKNTETAETHIEAYLRPEWGDVLVAELNRRSLSAWRDKLVKKPPRARRSMFAKRVKYQEDVDLTDPEVKRRRRASVNRITTTFKAVLNLAAEAHHEEITNAEEWRVGLKPYEKVDAKRDNYLRSPDITRLLNACPVDFRQLVAAALYTGCRYGELTRSTVGDYHREQQQLYVPESKSGKSRHVDLNDEGAKFFAHLAMGKRRGDLLLTRADGDAWGRGHQRRRIAEACHVAGLERLRFHELRHTYASLAVMNGLPLIVLAKNLGHTDTRMVERHYGHLSNEYARDQVRAHAPSFSVDTDDEVVDIDAKRVKNTGQHRK